MKTNRKDRLVYKLVRIDMHCLKVGDMFLMSDGPNGPERLDKVYKCTSNPTHCVEVEVIVGSVAKE